MSFEADMRAQAGYPKGYFDDGIPGSPILLSPDEMRAKANALTAAMERHNAASENHTTPTTLFK